MNPTPEHCEVCGKARLLAIVDGIKICGVCRENKK